MTKVVLQMLALGLEHVVGFICDFPAPAPRLCYRLHIIGGQVMIGNTAIVIEWYARVSMDDGARAPMDLQDIVTSAQESLVEVADHRYFRAAPMPVVRCTGAHSVWAGPNAPRS